VSAPPVTAPPLLALDGQVALGPRRLALRWQAPEGRHALMGPTGAGKSTLLQVVAGVLPLAAGALVVRGAAWAGPGRPPLPAHQRGVGWVPQDALLFPHLRVAENLGYAARLPLGPLIDWLELGALLDRRPRGLSGGERQRVALGRALAAAPQLLLLDEPFNALDAALAARVRAGLDAWCAERGLALVVVTHDPADAAALGCARWTLDADGVVHLR
jgi:ABC-type sulfate/molybdate transport systems ATPase subunit